jgi:hypothetical protein
LQSGARHAPCSAASSNGASKLGINANIHPHVLQSSDDLRAVLYFGQGWASKIKRPAAKLPPASNRTCAKRIPRPYIERCRTGNNFFDFFGPGFPFS